MLRISCSDVCAVVELVVEVNELQADSVLHGWFASLCLGGGCTDTDLTSFIDELHHEFNFSTKYVSMETSHPTVSCQSG